MAVRLIEMKRILKDTGSLYLHCDPTASHYLKLLLDTIFGHKNFRNEIVWCYSTSGRSKKFFAKKHDILFFYSNSDECFWSDYRIPVSDDYLKSHYKQRDKDGRRCRIRTDAGKTRTYYPEEGMICNDWWEIPYVNSMAKERVGYPTQKPLALLERVVNASSNKGDIVLDPFCGCATTCIAAEKLERKWIGIDVSEKAYDLVKDRLNREIPSDLFRGEPIFRKDIPVRIDVEYKKAPTAEDKKYLYGHQNGRCAACKTKFEIQHLEIDHIVPRSHGGGHELENLQLLCGHCNRTKGNKPMEYLMARLKAA